jgi:E3 ubiquitin-protein ligase listerin
LHVDVTGVGTSVVELAFGVEENVDLHQLHHVSALFLHPSRRVRFLAVSLHASFLRIPALRDQVLFFLQETASPSQTESILGAWSLAAHDIDRAVATTALKAWEETIISPSDVEGGSSSSDKHLVLDDNFLSSIGAFVQRTALDPSGIYEYLNPLPPIVTGGAPPGKKGQSGGKLSAVAMSHKDDSDTLTPRSKIDEQEESEQDRKARLRISALGVIRWIFSMSLSNDFTAMDESLTHP